MHELRRGAAEEAAMHAAAHACHTRSVRPGAGPLDPATDPFPLVIPTTGSASPVTASTGAAPLAARLLDLTARTGRLAPRPVDFTSLPW